MPQEKLTQFDYLLNAMHQAGLQENPAGHGYGGKRKALYAYVRSLEARAAAPEVAQQPIGHVRLDSGEVHIIPNDRDAEATSLCDGQPVYSAPPAQKVGAAVQRPPLMTEDELLAIANAVPTFDSGEVCEEEIAAAVQDARDAQWMAAQKVGAAQEEAEWINPAPAFFAHPAPRQEPAAPTASSPHTDAAAFKNFHRALCDRFGYTHDPIDWHRDQVSLEEHIAKLVAAPDDSKAPAALTPLTPAQRGRLYVNSPEHHKDATSRTGFERIVTLTERAHGIGAALAAPIREAHAEPVSASVYEAAVNGRQQMRAAFRQERERLRFLLDNWWFATATPEMKYDIGQALTPDELIAVIDKHRGAAAPLVAHDAASQRDLQWIARAGGEG